MCYWSLKLISWIIMKFCTCHDSTAVMAGAKFHGSHIHRILIMSRYILINFQLRTLGETLPWSLPMTTLQHHGTQLGWHYKDTVPQDIKVSHTSPCSAACRPYVNTKQKYFDWFFFLRKPGKFLNSLFSTWWKLQCKQSYMEYYNSIFT